MYLIPLLLAAAAAGYMVSRQLAQDAPALVDGTVLSPRRVMPAFTLTDQDGAAFGNAQLTGKPGLLFFGFTHCPDVCPVTLALMAQLRRDPALATLRAMFVSVDPRRDDIASLKRYVEVFDGGITALRGEDAALAPLLKGLGVAQGITELPGGSYTVDHSATLYFLDAAGQWSAVFTPPFEFQRLRRDLVALVTAGY